MKKPLHKAISFVVIMVITPAVPQTSKTQVSDFPATVKSVVTSVNTVSEIYEKRVLTNGDVIVISTVACSDLQLVRSNGTTKLVSDIIANYPNKEDLKKFDAKNFSDNESELFSKAGASETAQRVIASQILTTWSATHVNLSTNAEENLRQLEGVACQLKDKDLGDPKAVANEDVIKLGHALANAVIGIAAAVIDIEIVGDTAGLTIQLVGFASTGWAWDRLSSAWEEAKVAWASLTGQKDAKPEKKD